ncbi:MAG: hypothetical protein N3E36_07275 [Sulfolobales archaeon]|nr:hypothetical protein [Sulfolobales archaeon]
MNSFYFDALITFFFSLDVLLHLLNRSLLEECGVILLIQGILISVTAFLHQHYCLTIASKMITILNIFIVLNLSLINMLIPHKLHMGSSILMTFLFNTGFVTLLQSFIAKFNNVDEHMLYSLGITSTIINLLKLNNKSELIFMTLIVITTLYLNNRLPKYCTHAVKALILFSIMSTFYTMPHITFVTSSILLSKSYGYLESPPNISTGYTPSYGFKSLLYTVASFTLISIVIELRIIDAFT